MIRVYLMQEQGLTEGAQARPGCSFCPPGESGPVITLNEYHWKRIGACKREADKRRRLMGCLLAAYALYETNGAREGAIELPPYTIMEDGKPCLPDDRAFRFNLSHSGDYAVCAASEKPVGVDIQERRDVPQGLAGRFFSLEEQRLLSQAETERREELFFRLWSAKEAYMKYTGRGMRQGMQTFTADLQHRTVRESRSGRTAYLTEVDLPRGKARICVCGEELGCRVRVLPGMAVRQY